MSLSRHESWHLFVAPIYIKKQGESGYSTAEYAGALKKEILRDSHFKLKERRFHIETPNDYNVFQYFFDDARRSIFWFDNAENRNDGAILFRLNVTDRPYKNEDAEPIGEILLRIFESNKQSVEVKNDVNQEAQENQKTKENQEAQENQENHETKVNKAILLDEIQLDLMDVDITFYQFGVGNISFLCRYRHPTDLPGHEQEFYKYVLMINDRMRRLYLHWLSKGLENCSPDDLSARITAQVDGRAPYHDIRISVHDKNCNQPYCEEDFIEEDYSNCLVYEALDMSGVNRPSLLEYTLGGMDKKRLGLSFELLEDNRMFVVSYILPRHLENFLDITKWNGLESLYETNNWHKILTIDSPKNSMITNNADTRRLNVITNTYTRWLDKDEISNTTLFGYTKHSLVMIGSRSNFHFKNVVKLNFLHQYSEMVRLVLAQSASVHLFGKVIYDISGKISSSGNELAFGADKKLYSEVSTFKQSINDFTNRLLFRLYRLIQGKQEISTHMNEMKEEINQLSDHMDMRQRQNQEKSIHLLTQTTIILGVLTFITGFFGSNFFSMENGRMIVDLRSFALFFGIMIISYIGASFMPSFGKISFRIGDKIRNIFSKRKENKRKENKKKK